MKACPALVGTEVRRAVVTIGVGAEVAVIIIIGFAREERCHGARAKAGANLRVARAQSGVVHFVVGQVGVEGRHIVPLRLPRLLTEHGGDAVLAELVAVGDVVLQSPERAGVLLQTAGVLSAVPCAQVHLRLVGLGLRPAQVVAQLSVPGDVLNGCDVGEDATRELLTVEQDVVHHGQCDGVGAGVAFLRHVGVVAVDVVDLDVGRCDERIIDDTLVGVGELQVVSGLRIRDVQTQLQPRLQVGIEVGANAEAIEVRTDDGTFLVHVVTRHVVAHLVGTALGAYLMLVLQGRLEDGVLPVGTLAEDGGVAVGLVGLGDFALVHHVVIVFSELAQVHDVETFHLAVDGERAVVGELGLACLTALRGDEHNTIGTLCTVDGGGRGVLQDFHRHDVGRVQR